MYFNVFMSVLFLGLNLFRNSPDICWHIRPTFPASTIISSPFISVSQTKMENQLNNEVQSDTVLHIFSLLSFPVMRQIGHSLIGILGCTLIFAETENRIGCKKPE